MARGVNKVILIGNLGADPETRVTAQGSTITNLNIATDESYKDRNTGQMVPKTEWHRIVLFNRLAEIARDYLKKGSKLYLEGRLQTRKWQDKSGQDRYTTEIVGQELQMLDSKPGGHDQSSYGQAAPQQNFNQAPPADAPAFQGSNTQQAAPAPSPTESLQPVAEADFDDDIPF